MRNPFALLVAFASLSALGAQPSTSASNNTGEDPKVYPVDINVAGTWQATLPVTPEEKGVPSAHVVRLPHASHYVFRSNEADVLREIHEFIDGLPQ